MAAFPKELLASPRKPPHFCHFFLYMYSSESSFCFLRCDCFRNRKDRENLLSRSARECSNCFSIVLYYVITRSEALILQELALILAFEDSLATLSVFQRDDDFW